MKHQFHDFHSQNQSRIRRWNLVSKTDCCGQNLHIFSEFDQNKSQASSSSAWCTTRRPTTWWPFSRRTKNCRKGDHWRSCPRGCFPGWYKPASFRRRSTRWGWPGWPWGWPRGDIIRIEWDNPFLVIWYSSRELEAMFSFLVRWYWNWNGDFYGNVCLLEGRRVFYPLGIKHGNGKSHINGRIIYKWGIFHCYVWFLQGNPGYALATCSARGTCFKYMPV